MRPGSSTVRIANVPGAGQEDGEVRIGPFTWYVGDWSMADAAKAIWRGQSLRLSPHPTLSATAHDCLHLVAEQRDRASVRIWQDNLVDENTWFLGYFTTL